MNTDDEIKLRRMELTDDGLGLFAEATLRLHQDRRLCAFQIDGDGAIYLKTNSWLIIPEREGLIRGAGK